MSAPGRVRMTVHEARCRQCGQVVPVELGAASLSPTEAFARIEQAIDAAGHVCPGPKEAPDHG